MTLNEQYLMYTLADELIKKYDYNLLYVNEKTNEIWLEKYENRSSKVVRLIHKGFDWKNHLKHDISVLFQRIRNVRRIFGKNVEVYNLYFTTYPPVDSWEGLKKPINSQGKPNVKMKVYYFDQEDYPKEVERFERDLLDAPFNYNFDLPEETKENIIERAKHEFIYSLHNKRKEVQQIFSFGKPIFSFLFIIINLLYFFYIEMNGDSTSVETLIAYGAKYNPAIILDGEWWRLITSMFIHIGFLHLALNMLAVFYLGNAIEKIFGSARFLFIYFIAGLGGSIASFAFTTSISAGASGAIFGLFGAFLYFGIKHKRLFFQTIGTSILLILAINLVIGLTIEQIDMAAHVGGLIAGFLGAAIVGLPKNKRLSYQIASLVLVIVSFTVGTIYGVSANENSQAFQLLYIQELITEEKFDEVINTATEALTLDGDLDHAILFQRSYAYIELEKYDRAIADLEESITYDATLPEAYYNLALLYQMQGEGEKAIAAIEEAYRLNPTSEDINKLFEKLTEELQE